MQGAYPLEIFTRAHNLQLISTPHIRCGYATLPCDYTANCVATQITDARCISKWFTKGSHEVVLPHSYAYKFSRDDFTWLAEIAL